MKTNLLHQLSLTALLAFSLSACQKKDNSSASPAPTATPVETAQESENTQKMTREEALTNLANIGLRFAAPTPSTGTEIDEVTTTWDVDYYRTYLRAESVKPDLQIQIQVLNDFITASEASVQDDLDSNSEEVSNESVRDVQKVFERSLVLSQIGLAQARVAKLERRLAFLQSREKETTEKDTEKTPTEDGTPEDTK